MESGKSVIFAVILVTSGSIMTTTAAKEKFFRCGVSVFPANDPSDPDGQTTGPILTEHTDPIDPNKSSAEQEDATRPTVVTTDRNTDTDSPQNTSVMSTTSAVSDPSDLFSEEPTIPSTAEGVTDHTDPIDPNKSSTEQEDATGPTVVTTDRNTDTDSPHNTSVMSTTSAVSDPSDLFSEEPTIPSTAEGVTAVPSTTPAGCWIEEFGGILADGQAYVNQDCSRKDICKDDAIVSDPQFTCSEHATCETQGSEGRCICLAGYEGDGQTCTFVPSNCLDIDINSGSGLYNITPADWPGDPFQVYCNMGNGGGWTVFQRRIDGSQDFYLDWEAYKEGFGDLSQEFWLGNEKLYYLTNQRDFELRVDLENGLGARYYSSYALFRINNEADGYKLSGLGHYTGSGGNPLEANYGWRFSTKDRDNDGAGIHCAVEWQGGWWYKWCGGCNPNGNYGGSGWARVFWNYLPDDHTGVKKTEFQIRPV